MSHAHDTGGTEEATSGKSWGRRGGAAPTYGDSRSPTGGTELHMKQRKATEQRSTKENREIILGGKEHRGYIKVERDLRDYSKCRGKENLQGKGRLWESAATCLKGQ